MKFALAVLVYLIIASILGAGILLVMAGKPWFLAVGRGVAFISWHSAESAACQKSHIEPVAGVKFHFAGTAYFICITGMICDGLEPVALIDPANIPDA